VAVGQPAGGGGRVRDVARGLGRGRGGGGAWARPRRAGPRQPRRRARMPAAAPRRDIAQAERSRGCPGARTARPDAGARRPNPARSALLALFPPSPHQLQSRFLPVKMRVVAAVLLAQLGGKANPGADDVKKILGSGERRGVAFRISRGRPGRRAPAREGRPPPEAAIHAPAPCAAARSGRGGRRRQRD
jgi:hypothetical protein